MATSEEKESLLRSTSADSGSTYGAENAAGDPDLGELVPRDASGMVDGEGDSQGMSKQSSGKQERSSHNPSLDKVDEDLEKELLEGQKSAKRISGGCPDYFGVKSYLHNFYETHVYKDPEIYEEDDDFRFLLHANPRRRRCTSIWWKVFVWIGANFLVFGIIGVLVGYLVPQRPIIVGSMVDRPNIEIIDREAISFNFNLDVCKLVGLILFCIGGLTLTVALLFPSFLYQYCDEDRKDSAFRVRASAEEKLLKSPIEMTIPVTSKIRGVQPERKDEAIVTQEGMVAIKD